MGRIYQGTLIRNVLDTAPRGELVSIKLFIGSDDETENLRVRRI